MRVLVTGTAGQLGHDVAFELQKRGHIPICSDISDVPSTLPPFTRSLGSVIPDPAYIPMDITDRSAVRSVIEKLKPDAIIHCAAWTAVDAAEEKENRQKVDLVNHIGTQNIAEAAKTVDAKMMYISTDYVFDGQGTKPWEPDCMEYAPLNVYGQSKLDGEFAVSSLLQKFFIVRIAWVFGLNGNNFIKTMIRVGRSHDTVRVVYDQIGTPTYTKDLARLLVDLVESDKFGYYHATNAELPEDKKDSDGTKAGYISWYDFTKEIFRQAGISSKVIPVTTAEYGLSKAARPFNSRLDKSKLVAEGFIPLPDWKSAVHRYLLEAKLIDGSD